MLLAMDIAAVLADGREDDLGQPVLEVSLALAIFDRRTSL